MHADAGLWLRRCSLLCLMAALLLCSHLQPPWSGTAGWASTLSWWATAPPITACSTAGQPRHPWQAAPRQQPGVPAAELGSLQLHPTSLSVSTRCYWVLVLAVTSLAYASYPYEPLAAQQCWKWRGAHHQSNQETRFHLNSAGQTAMGGQQWAARTVSKGSTSKGRRSSCWRRCRR